MRIRGTLSQRPPEAVGPDRARAIRRVTDLTQEDLADLLGIVTRSVSRWERSTCPDVQGSSALLLSLIEARGLDHVLYSDHPETVYASMGPERIRGIMRDEQLSGIRLSHLLWCTSTSVSAWLSGRNRPEGTRHRPGPSATRLLHLISIHGIYHIILPSSVMEEPLITACTTHRAECTS